MLGVASVNLGDFEIQLLLLLLFSVIWVLLRLVLCWTSPSFMVVVGYPLQWHSCCVVGRSSDMEFSFSDSSTLCVCSSLDFAGTKSMSAKDDAEVESSLLGGVGAGGVYLSDALYSEDSVLSSSCHFTLGDVDPEDSGLALFGDVTDDGKVDYSWDNCLSDLEDVDNLLRWASFPG